MAFTYAYGANPVIDYPRMLIADTECTNHIFEDSEIMAFYVIQSAQFQSSMLYSFGQGQNLPMPPVSYLRVAALMLMAIAGSQSRLRITKLLDVSLSPDKAAQSLRDQANQWLEMDDNAGAFVIIEQVKNGWDFQDRFWKQMQRTTGGL